jgi:regulator of cell morphogenesis and NO signaling
MKFNTTMTVRELAVDKPHAMRILEGFRIDYCCGGDRTFADACDIAGVEAAEVLRVIEETGSAPAELTPTVDFRTMPLTALTEHIVLVHHIFTRQELDRLSFLFEKVCSAHHENHPELHRMKFLFLELCNDLRPHMQREEQILFPFVAGLQAAVDGHLNELSAPFGTVLEPVRTLMSEHETAGVTLQDLRTISNEFTVPADGCTSFHLLYQGLEEFEHDLHQHVHLENNILFPRLIELEGMFQKTVGPR